MIQRFCVEKSPSHGFPFNNCVAVHPGDFPDELVHVLVNGCPLTVKYVLRIALYKLLITDQLNRHDEDGQMAPGFIGVSLAQRRWIDTTVGAQVTVERCPGILERGAPKFARAIEIEVNFIHKGHGKEFHSKAMATSFVDNFKGTVVTTGREIPFMLHGEALIGAIKSVDLGGGSSVSPPSRNTTGIIFKDTNVKISKVPGSAIIIKPGARPVHTAPLVDPTQLGRYFSGTGKVTINGGIFVQSNTIADILLAFQDPTQVDRMP